MDKSFNSVSVIVEDEAVWECRLEDLTSGSRLIKGVYLHSRIEPMTKKIRKGLHSQLQRAISCHKNTTFDRAVFLASNKGAERGTGCISDRAEHRLIVHANIVDSCEA